MSAKCDGFGVGLVLRFFFGRVAVSPHDRMGSLPWSDILSLVRVMGIDVMFWDDPPSFAWAGWVVDDGDGPP